MLQVFYRAAILVVIGTLSSLGQAQAQKPRADAFLQEWNTDHDGTLSHAEINKAASARFDALDRKQRHVLCR